MTYRFTEQTIAMQSVLGTNLYNLMGWYEQMIYDHLFFKNIYYWLIEQQNNNIYITIMIVVIIIWNIILVIIIIY